MIKVGTVARLKINNVVGWFRVIVVQDVTKTGQADWIPHADGEQLLEVRYTTRPVTGRYAFCGASDLI